MKTIQTPQFLEAFAAEWQARLQHQREALMSAYCNCRTWTDYMLSYDGGLLKGVMQRLHPLMDSLDYSKEIYSIDAMFVGGENLFRNNLCYPSQLQVLIEHEHGEHVEEEMWKLIFWRASLKVLIFYDWNEDQKGTMNRISWIDNKLGTLRTMLGTANSHAPQPDQAEYLFVIGNQETANGDVRWRWTSADSICEPTLFIGH